MAVSAWSGLVGLVEVGQGGRGVARSGQVWCGGLCSVMAWRDGCVAV